MKATTLLRWLLVPIAAMTSCSGTVVAATAVRDAVVGSIGPEHGVRIESLIAADYRSGLVHALAAVAWVVAGTWAAPRHRAAVAVVLYAAGAWLAVVGLDGWHFPEGHPRAYQVSRVPMVVTLAGGLLATLAIVATGRLRRSVRGAVSPESRAPGRSA